MAHIHTKPGQHDVTTSAYIIRTDTTEPSLILHLHKAIGTYMQFGGHIELNENPWQTIKREIVEETGYRMNQLSLLQPKDRLTEIRDGILMPQPVCVASYGYMGPSDKNHIHDDLIFAFVANEKPRGSSGHGESDDIKLVTRQELESSALPISNTVRDIGVFIFDECLKNWEQIPAAKIRT